MMSNTVQLPDYDTDSINARIADAIWFVLAPYADRNMIGMEQGASLVRELRRRGLAVVAIKDDE